MMYTAIIHEGRPAIKEFNDSIWNLDNPDETFDDAHEIARAYNINLQSDIRKISSILKKCASDLAYNSPIPYGIQTPDMELIEAQRLMDEARGKINQAEKMLMNYRSRLSWEITTK